MEIVTIDQLEKTLDELNETVQGLTKEEMVLQDLVNGLEKDLDESAVENVEAMIERIDVLGKEKAIKESELERLMEDKNSSVSLWSHMI